MVRAMVSIRNLPLSYIPYVGPAQTSSPRPAAPASDASDPEAAAPAKPRPRVSAELRHRFDLTSQLFQAKATQSLDGQQGVGAPLGKQGVAEPPVPRNIGVSNMYKLGPTLAEARQGPKALNRGEGGSGVFELQRLLKSSGFDVQPDGKFGAGTEDAVKAFQKLHGLTPDGKAGRQTIQALEASQPRGAGGPGLISPDTLIYGDKAKVSDSTKLVGPDGKFDATKVLGNLTQFDENAKTTLDAGRCGSAAVMAAGMSTNGQAGLEAFAKKTASMCDDVADRDGQRAAKAILKRIQSGDATYGDLGKLQDLCAKNYGTIEQTGVSNDTMKEMFKDYGIKAKEYNGGTLPELKPGEVMMPALMDLDRDGNSDHFVLFGTDAHGKKYAYDSLPKPGASQLISSADPLFDMRYSLYQHMAENSSGQ